jgi:DUF2920 family protein
MWPGTFFEIRTQFMKKETDYGHQISIKKKIQSIVDPELNVNTKSELSYYINFPDNYSSDKKYPLIICIDGFGGSPSSEYQEKKLRPYLCKKYNAIVVGVLYHCIERGGGQGQVSLGVWDMVFNLGHGEFKKRYIDCKPSQNILDGFFDILVERNITRVPQCLAIPSTFPDAYSSFGFLPAIEHLHVIHDVISNYSIKLSEINVLGTSYGGYIALLLGKYAPNTFNVIIDNSGFVSTQMAEIYPSEHPNNITHVQTIDGIRYEIPFSTQSIWENDEFSERYFSDSHRMIRNVSIIDHMFTSKTKYFSYHSQEDSNIPIFKKQFFCTHIKDFAHIDFTIVTGNDIDGKLFKHLNHGMSASLRELYDVSFDKNKHIAIHHDESTDFHIGSSYIFKCFSKQYDFSYNLTKGLEVKVSKLSD